MTGFPVGR